MVMRGPKIRFLTNLGNQGEFMRNLRILASLALTVISGCGGGSSSGPSPTPLPISVSLSATPPASLATGATANVSATVLNDSAGKGVTWSCTPAAACGTFNPTSTASGAATVFTAPATAPAGGSVTITATSTTDGTKFASAVVTFLVSISLGTAPPASLQASGTANVSALVTNDPGSLGVAWSCAPSGSCGSFNPSSTTSGGVTVYTAPATVPAGGNVTITATSVTDNTKNTNQTITITPPVAVTMTTPPPGAMQTSTKANLAASVTNDAANLGVTWSCTPISSCGSFSLSPTSSGGVTVYSAPATTTSAVTVTITATSVSDPTKMSTATVKIATLIGQYAFFIQAPTGARGTTVFVGSVNLDGNGNVLGGMEDVISPNYNDQADPILPTSSGTIPNASYYTVDPSGHGTLRMVTQNNEALDLSFVLTSGLHGLVIEADGNPGSGTLDLQQPTATGFDVSQISGTYSFILDGVDVNHPPVKKPSIGGVFKADGVAKLANGIMDVNTGGILSSDAFTGTIDPPDANGRGQLTIFLPSTSNPSFRIFIYYLVSPKVLRIFEDDGFDLMGGSVYSQGAAGTTLAGNYVYRHSGWSAAGRTVAAGQFTATAAGIVTGGVSDANAGGSPTVPTTGKAVSGSYTIPATLNGTMTLTEAAGNSTFNVYMVDPSLNILDPNNASGSGGALLLHTDANISGTGLLIPQNIPTSPTFAGNYALNLANSIAVATPDELDLVGVMTGDGIANFGGGLADYDHNNNAPTPVFGAGLTGTFGQDSVNAGHFTGNLSVTPTAGSYPFIPGAASPTVFNVSYYQASASQAFVIETDTLANIEGTLVQLQLP
jgi:hypothetical protein